MSQNNFKPNALRHKAKMLPHLHEADIFRYQSKVDKTTEFGPRGDCWRYCGTLDKDGYGKFMCGKRNLCAHRIAYFLHKGIDPFPHLVLHSCDNPQCVYPEHLSLGSDLDNRRDCKNKGRTATGNRNGQRVHPERTARGERHHGAKFTKADIIQIRDLYAYGFRDRAIAKMFGVTKGAIWFVRTGRAWKHIPIQSPTSSPSPQIPLSL